MEENLKPLEENGFIIADFTRESITVRYFRFNYHKQAGEVIDTLGGVVSGPLGPNAIVTSRSTTV